MPIPESAPPARVRPLARDAGTERVGEVMDISYTDDRPVQVWLRPVGGGAEWIADPELVQLLERDEQGAP